MPAGRKSKYQTHVEPKLFLIESWARDGLTDEQIAKNLGVSKESFYKYKNEFTEFSDALKKGKEIIDYEVENALLKRAIGYKYNEITQEPVEIKRSDGTKITMMQPTKIVSKQVAPDVGAAAFWLKNRKPDKWRDKPQDDSATEEVIKKLDDVLGGIKSEF